VGRFYTNVTVRGPEQAQVAGAVRAARYRAWISPTITGLTVVCESRSESQNLKTWHAVARKLSLVLNCPALAALNHDDSVLLYALYDRGALVDEYDSNPDFSKPAKHSPTETLRLLATVLVFVLTRPFRSFQPLVDKVRPPFKPSAKPKSPPSGGNAPKLCELLGIPGDPAEVQRVLRSVWRKAGDEFLFNADQHRALVHALGWPADDQDDLDLDCLFHAGFEYMEGCRYGNPPPGWLKTG
jgi:hypothetical protein